MKTVLAVNILFSLTLASGLAQNLGNAKARAAGGVTFTSPSGFGNVLYPGTGGPGQSFPSQLAATVAGAPLNTRQPQRRNNNGKMGIGYPIYVGGYGMGYASDYSLPSQVDPGYQQPYAAQQQPVIINQYFTTAPAYDPITAPAAEIYHAYPERQPSEEPQASAAPSYYLLAFKDHSVYSALAYWIEDKTLHYVTPQKTHNQASLDLVDVEFTKKLNLNRDMPFTVVPTP